MLWPKSHPVRIDWRDITRVEVIMAKAYWVVTYRAIKNQDAFAAYAKLAGPAVQASGGRFIVRGAPGKTYEAGMNQRVSSSSSTVFRRRLRHTIRRNTALPWKPWAMVRSAISALSKALRKRQGEF